MLLDATPDEADLFNPAHYDGVRRPLLEAETMPAWCYTSPAFFKREIDRIFRTVWNPVGRADRLPVAGDYTTLDFAGIPLIIVRGQDGVLRGFANICRHRGSLMLEGEGNCQRILCPYHSWGYALDGSLIGTPAMEQTKGFDAAAYALLPVRLETWGGFMFICFDAKAESLSSYLGDIDTRLAAYGLNDMVCTRRREYDMACNWKLFVENAKEAYHIGTVHQKTINQYASARSAGYWVEDTTGQYCVTFAQHEGSMALLKGDAGFPLIEGLIGSREAGGTYAPLIYPGMYLACTIDCAWYLEIHPLAADRTKLIHGALFPRSRLDRPDFQDVAANYYKRWDITLEEDIVASERQQKGLTSPFSLPGRFSHREPLVHVIDNWILDRVLDA